MRSIFSLVASQQLWLACAAASAWLAALCAPLAACEAAGLQAVDPKTEPPAIAALLTAGTLASCKGKPKDFAFGPLVQVTAQLDQAKVISFIFDLDAAQADVGKKIDAA